MFDDIPVQGGVVPPNLPIGEPEDIFAAVPDDVDTPNPVFSSPSMPPLESSPEEALGGGKTALSAGMLQPKHTDGMESDFSSSPSLPPSVIPNAMPQQNVVLPPVPVPTQHVSPPMATHTMPTDVPEMYALKEPKASKGIITIIIVVVVLFVLGGGGLFIYNQFIAGTSQTTDLPIMNGEDVSGANAFETVPDTTQDSTDSAGENTVTSGTINRPPEETSDILFGDPTDEDADGLDDERERGLGTDSAHWDTDGDELSDGDEVIIWKTDPLNPDTDGDGFPDGQEIKNGYSPTGAGKIFEPPTETESASN